MSAGTSSHSSNIENNPNINVLHVAIPSQPGLHGHQALLHSTAPVQTIHVTTIDEGLNHESKKRREILARRPSYRKILNELSSDGPSIPCVDKIEEESNSSQDEEETNLNAVQYQATSVPQAIQITAHPQGSAVGAGLQTLTMTNASNSSPGATPGATIVQYAQGPDGQFYIPVGGGGVQAYQLASATALTPNLMMTQPGSGMSSPIHGTEEVSRKRELRLLKNREAARECRRKKKEYVKCLENRVAVLENQNKTLIEELKALKELYCQKEG